MNLEDWKIDRLMANGTPLSSLRTLSQDEAQRLRFGLLRLLGLDPKTSDYDLVGEMQRAGPTLVELNARSDTFNLGEACRALGVRPTERVVLWFTLDADFHEVEEMSGTEFDHHFHDLWFPHSNDLAVISPQADWFLYIDHMGLVWGRAAEAS